MIVFTLAAILIYQMKLASHSVVRHVNVILICIFFFSYQIFQQDGTLIGTSFLICFGYWIGSSFAISSVSFVCNTHLSLMQILSLNVNDIRYELRNEFVVLWLFLLFCSSRVTPFSVIVSFFS